VHHPLIATIATSPKENDMLKINVTDSAGTDHRLDASNWTVEEDGSLWLLGPADSAGLASHVAVFARGWSSLVVENAGEAK
jgi:hypothetical protein